MPRINRVKSARRKQGRCGKCGKDLDKGAPYIWIQRYRSSKQKRCVAPGCAFRDSDLTGSEKLARIYDARDEATSAIDGWDPGDDNDASELRDALETCIDECREVAEEYQESADNIRENFAESPTADECEERSQEIESWVDEMDSARDECDDFEPEADDDDDESDDDSKSDDDDDDDEKKNSDGQTRAEWAEALRDRARGAVEDCPV